MYISTTPEKRICNLKMIRIPKPDFFLIQRFVHFQLSLFFWEETTGGTVDPFEKSNLPSTKQKQIHLKLLWSSFGDHQFFLLYTPVN